MAFATGGPAVQPDGLRRIATVAEELGFDSIWSTEHVVVPTEYTSVYPYNPTGRIPVPPETPMPDPLIPLAFAAAVTSRILLGTAVVILPEHHPLQVAKSVAHLDVLSGGRVLLGVGVGWLREEYEALGVDFTTRGKRMDAQIDALRSCWSPGATSVDSEFFSWHDVHVSPKPARPDGVPIHISGHSPAAARRAARVGDGFIPGVSSPEEFAAIMELVRAECAKLDRDPATIEMTAGCNGLAYSADDVQRLHDLGAHRVHAAFFADTVEEVEAKMRHYAEDVMQVVGVDN